MAKIPLDNAASIGNQLMGAASAGKPAIMVTAGPRGVARVRGKPVVTDDIWSIGPELLEGTLSLDEWDLLEDSFCASVGVCNVMATANTMAVVAEVLGMALPGSAVVPATQSRRSDVGERTGVRAVELALQGVTPDRLLSEAAFENALRVLVAIGGSTNGVIHLEGNCSAARNRTRPRSSTTNQP